MSKFTFNFTQSHLQQMIPGNNEVAEWYQSLCEILPQYDITTPERVVGFVSQCAHESNNFRTLEENLNYSADNLLKTFSRYFGPAPKRNASEYAGNPEKIANYVYMDEFRSTKGQMGNTQPGDGWRFRGRGIKQLTGRNNYSAFGRTVGMTAEQAADYVATKKGALESACWFWKNKNLNRFADSRDVKGLTRAINGGDIGLADRTNRWNNGLRIVGNSATVGAPVAETARPSTTTLRRGSSGPEVSRLQTALGIRATGTFDANTETALIQWQRGARLAADGIAGPQTLSRLLR
jgi:putative chitinase